MKMKDKMTQMYKKLKIEKIYLKYPANIFHVVNMLVDIQITPSRLKNITKEAECEQRGNCNT